MSTEKNIQNIIELIRRDDSVDAPADSIRWASNLFRTRAVEPKPSLIRKLAAVLQMEIASDKPAFGERSGAASMARQMLFNAEENAVDIRIEHAKKGFDLRGQILGEGFANAQIHLADDDRTFETAAGETSEFALYAIPAGRYDLTIHGAGVEITLKHIDVT